VLSERFCIALCLPGYFPCFPIFARCRFSPGVSGLGYPAWGLFLYFRVYFVFFYRRKPAQYSFSPGAGFRPVQVFARCGFSPGACFRPGFRQVQAFGMGALQQGRRAASALGVYSLDDLGWLCGWGGERLLRWEEVGLDTCDDPFVVDPFVVDPCVVDHVEWWLEKEEAHVRMSESRTRHMLPPMSEQEMLELYEGVYERRWARACQSLRRRRTLCADVRFVDVL
jgi:hypothetical protein